MSVKRGDFFLLFFLLFLSSCSTEYQLITPTSRLLADFHKNKRPYLIGCGDVLDISVWGYDGLSARVVVRPDGGISVPLVGEVEARGVTVEALKRLLVREIGKYIRSPSVSVKVYEIRSMKYYVIGEVAKPGEYSLEVPVNVLQAIARAGGFSMYAKTDHVQIIRTEGSRKMKIRFKYSQVIKGKNLNQNIPLRPGDVIVVP